MDIYVYYDSKGACLSVEHPTLGILQFHRESASEIEKILLTKELKENLQRDMREIRRISYLRGWRDAKAKRRKHDCFSSFPSVMSWEKEEVSHL